MAHAFPISVGIFGSLLFLLVAAALGAQPDSDRGDQIARHRADPMQGADERNGDGRLRVRYLEFVTPDVNATCEVLSRAHGVVFGEPVAALGNARTADLEGGGRLGVRAPLRDTEDPVVRPYILVDDIDAAVAAARNAGAEVAIPPLEIPGEGTFSIYILGGIEHGLWQR